MPKGVYITPAFPKLLCVDEDNIREKILNIGKYKLAAKEMYS